MIWIASHAWLLGDDYHVMKDIGYSMTARTGAVVHDERYVAMKGPHKLAIYDNLEDALAFVNAYKLTGAGE